MGWTCKANRWKLIGQNGYGMWTGRLKLGWMAGWIEWKNWGNIELIGIVVAKNS